jgi:hypothetical protein
VRVSSLMDNQPNRVAQHKRKTSWVNNVLREIVINTKLFPVHMMVATTSLYILCFLTLYMMNDGKFEVLIVTSIFTFRVLAATFAAISIVNYFCQRKKDEYPPYSRRLNELAWNWGYAGLLIGGTSFVIMDLAYVRAQGVIFPDIIVASVWWCFANAITVKLSSRSPRPFYVYAAATIFIIGAGSYSILMGV